MSRPFSPDPASHRGLPSYLLLLAFALGACASSSVDPSPEETVGSRPSSARAADGSFISWREHLIDDESLSGVALAGSDGVSGGDVDGDGWLDLVSVHEADTEYHGVADGLIRLSFGSPDPEVWESITLAHGAEAGAAEDAAVGDLNGDGHPDVVAAVELAHLIYFENPGERCREAWWPRRIPSITQGRGSFIRVFLADFDQDGRPEVVAANKGDQEGDTVRRNPISWFELKGDPLDDASWIEHEFTRVVWPINAQPVDLDGDGDLDVVAGSVAETRILWFENTSTEEGISFVEHAIRIEGSYRGADGRLGPRPDVADAVAAGDSAPSHGVTGFNMDYHDLDGDSRLDIVVNEFFQNAVWLRQPADPDQAWTLHSIGCFHPDQLVGLALADIDGDGDQDVFCGGYSRGPRDTDLGIGVDDPLGRLAWFENPGDPTARWPRHDVSRRRRGMFDKLLATDLDSDGDIDFITTRGNSVPYDGVLWLEQVRSPAPLPAFQRARAADSPEMPLSTLGEPAGVN